MRFGEHLGIKTVSVNEEEAVLEIDVDDRHLNPFGSVHGGVLSALADQTGGYFLYHRGYITPTIDFNIHYLRPGLKTTKLVCHSVPLKLGKKVAVMQSTVVDQDGQELCTGIFTYMITEHKY